MNPVQPKVLVAVALATLLAGCATAPDRPAPGTRPPPVAQVAPPPVVAPEPADDAAAATAMRPSRQIEEGTGRFIDREAAQPSRPAPGEAGEISFNFEGESLHAVVKVILGDYLQENYVIAPGVQGTVTFSTARPLRGDQALSILEMLLRWNNATLVWEDGRYTVLPVSQAIPGNLTPRVGGVRGTRGYEVRAVPLQYISATEMEKLLKPYARNDAVVSVDNARNMIVLAGTGAELSNYLQTIQVFDVDWLEGMSVGIFPLAQTEATEIVGELDKVFGPGSDTPMAGMFRFMPLEGINAVMVITPQPKYLATAEEWLQRLDLGAGQAGQRLYVYDVKNVKAVDLATTLGDVFGTSVGGAARAGDSGDFIAPGLESVEVRSLGREGRPMPPQQDPQVAERNVREGGPAGSGRSGPVVDARGGIALGATDEVRISAVEESNAILVLCTSSQWESIHRVIERLDQIPLQVQIEAQIIQVNLNESLRYGVQWYFENGIAGLGSIDGEEGEDGTIGDGQTLLELSRNRSIWGDIGGNAGATGVNWTFVGPNIAAVISALDGVSELQVLSAPSLVVLNNKAASINVGTQIPVVSSFLNPIGGGNTGGGSGSNFNTSYVQFRETGITLDVTPRVNPGGLVFMEISQNDSEPGASSDAIAGNLPVNQRTITTEIAVQSGETVLLGGLIKHSERSGSGGVPFLSRIPVLGALFGNKNRSSERQELLVLIKPTVIRNPQDARDITEEYKSRFRGLEPLRVHIDPPIQAPQPDPITEYEQ